MDQQDENEEKTSSTALIPFTQALTAEETRYLRNNMIRRSIDTKSKDVFHDYLLNEYAKLYQGKGTRLTPKLQLERVDVAIQIAITYYSWVEDDAKNVNLARTWFKKAEQNGLLLLKETQDQEAITLARFYLFYTTVCLAQSYAQTSPTHLSEYVKKALEYHPCVDSILWDSFEKPAISEKRLDLTHLLIKANLFNDARDLIVGLTPKEFEDISNSDLITLYQNLGHEAFTDEQYALMQGYYIQLLKVYEGIDIKKIKAFLDYINVLNQSIKTISQDVNLEITEDQSTTETAPLLQSLIRIIKKFVARAPAKYAQDLKEKQLGTEATLLRIKSEASGNTPTHAEKNADRSSHAIMIKQLKAQILNPPSSPESKTQEPSPNEIALNTSLNELEQTLKALLAHDALKFRSHAKCKDKIIKLITQHTHINDEWKKIKKFTKKNQTTPATQQLQQRTQTLKLAIESEAQSLDKAKATHLLNLESKNAENNARSSTPTLPVESASSANTNTTTKTPSIPFMREPRKELIPIPNITLNLFRGSMPEFPDTVPKFARKERREAGREFMQRVNQGSPKPNQNM